MRLTEEIRTILLYSRDEAMRTGCYGIAPEHLLLGLLRHGHNGAMDVLRKFGLDPARIKEDMDAHVFHEHAIPYEEQENVNYTRSSLNITNLTIMEAIRSGQDVSSVHLLAAICDSPGEFCSEYLHKAGLNLQVLRTMIDKSSGETGKKSSLPSTEVLNRLFGVFYKDKEFFS